MKFTILTSNGLLLDLADPDPKQILIDDIAHGLSRLCRFTGQVPVGHFSVAQNAIMVSRMLPPHRAMLGLLHNAAAAYVGDMSAQLKALVPDYRHIEAGVQAAIFAAVGVKVDELGLTRIAHVKKVVLWTELRDVMRSTLPPPDDVADDVAGCRVPFFLAPDEAKRQFLRDFYDITGASR